MVCYIELRVRTFDVHSSVMLTCSPPVDSELFSMSFQPNSLYFALIALLSGIVPSSLERLHRFHNGPEDIIPLLTPYLCFSLIYSWFSKNLHEFYTWQPEILKEDRVNGTLQMHQPEVGIYHSQSSEIYQHIGLKCAWILGCDNDQTI